MTRMVCSANWKTFWAWAVTGSLALAPVPSVAQALRNSAELEQEFRLQIRPILQRFCHECHAGDRTEAEIDLSVFVDMSKVRKQTKVWQKIRTMLDSGQMPPKKSKQPPPAQRKLLLQWVRDHLRREAQARAGDPGPVTLRRLSNDEYTYSIRDLTGIASLDPARQFPVDGAAGEGFTNTGSGLVMSPALVQKFLDAAKSISEHAVLGPNDIRFSAYATRRDQSDELMARIQEFYRRFTSDGGGSRVNLQGIVFDTNQGGRLPLLRYLAATIAEREALVGGSKTLEAVAQQHKLNGRYLALLWHALNGDARTPQSPPLDSVRRNWRNAGPADAAALVTEVEKWQSTLWKFNSIGHIGRVGGPRAWMEPANPVTMRQELKLKLPPSPGGQDVVFYLVVGDAGDGREQDVVVWKNPRLEGGGQPPLPLSKVAGLQQRLLELRRALLQNTARFLSVAAQAGRQPNTKQLAAAHNLNADALQIWLNYLGLADSGPVAVRGHFTKTMSKAANYDFVKGWGTPATPSVVANASDQEVRIPGISRPHSVVVHPSPSLYAAVGWQSPLTGVIRVQSRIADAHPECGNGVAWYLQHRTSAKTGNLWTGDFAVRGTATMPAKTLTVRKGELISLLVGPRQGNHACDLTEVNLVITEATGAKRVWDLAADVSGNILQSNPHADSHGHPGVWHFYKGALTEIAQAPASLVSIPSGSLLAQWQAEKDDAKRRTLADRIQALVTGKPPTAADSADGRLYRQIHQVVAAVNHTALAAAQESLDKRFGSQRDDVTANDMLVRAPSIVEFRVAASLIAGRELVASGIMHPKHGRSGSTQLSLTSARPTQVALNPSLPVLVGGDAAQARVNQGFDAFRQLFPAALCYARIVPVDETVTLTLFHREDSQLRRLMLDDQQAAQLDRLWDELYFVSQEPLKLVVAFEQISEFATQDRPDLVKAFKPMLKPITDRATAFRRRLLATEPQHMQSVLRIADRAWRRKLTDGEQSALRALYRTLRQSGNSHGQAIRLTLARVLTSPAFLYRREQTVPGKQATPVSPPELATRLSYFLWSSLPDGKLREVADQGGLIHEKSLLAETRRMLSDHRVRRLAIQFACQWLHVRGFDQNDDKNEKLYPQFAGLRGAMYEESVRFFEDMIRNNGSILGLIDADHTFLNEALAKHYGIDDVRGAEWRRVDGVRQHGRGGVLGMSSVLASQSGASRTSPILRGNWVFETLLGQRLPRPPANVPQLPETVPGDLTARQLIERHSSAPGCAKCHSQIDPYGFALERYDTIGRLRPGSVNTKTRLADGQRVEGLQGLRDYLLKQKRDVVVRQFCRKLLGYALGRSVQLSDEPLLERMRQVLETQDYGFHSAVETIVVSPQFREVRGRDMIED